MMAKSIDAGEDIIDVRDVIERFEELESEREDLEAATHEDGDEDTNTEGKAEELAAWDEENGEEFAILKSLLDELKGNGGDEQFRGDWYPITLIEESYFPKAMDELLEDIGDLPKDLPCYLNITVDYDALKMDYTSCKFGGFTYWYR